MNLIIKNQIFISKQFLQLKNKLYYCEQLKALSTVANSESLDDDTQSWAKKIVHNTYLEKYRPPRSWKWEMSEKWKKPIREATERLEMYSHDHPISLQYLSEFSNHTEVFSKNGPPEYEINNNCSERDMNKYQFPYKIYTPLELNVLKSDANLFQHRKDDKSKSFEIEEKEKKVNDHRWEIQYGFANPDIPASGVPCGGCGAHLHCQDTSIPGYMPAETFTILSEEELKGEICQRCFYLKNHNAALNVNVTPEMYPEILKKIKDHFAMVLLLVDLIDFPCSIWPNIIDIIGEKRPVLLVGNKVDLLPPDSRNYLNHIKVCLEETARNSGLDRANIVGTKLISATSGYGIEDLITKIHNTWSTKGDIFIMGCTNVGKSSLFNAFLQSDLCKVQVVDLVHRATISPWPGTTLNLLKFPVLKTDKWKKYYRSLRLREEKEFEAGEKSEKLMLLKKTRNPKYATLMGRVGQTFMSPERYAIAKSPEDIVNPHDIFNISVHSKHLPPVKKVGDWDPENPSLVGKWCYDTPGTVSENQILDLLTLPELMKVLPKDLIEPRTYYIELGMTVFIGGLARIDYVEGLKPIRYTVFTTSHIPITVCRTSDADEVYKNAFGTPIFGVPMGNNDRLNSFPAFKSAEFEFEGINHKESSGDIVISSTGFIAVTVGIGKFCRLVVHSPNGKGLFRRTPSLLPYTVNKKGKRIRDTPAYAPHHVYVPR